MYPTRKGKIIYNGKLGSIERYFEKYSPDPKYIFYDKIHKGKVNAKANLGGFKKYIKYLRNFYKNEIKLNKGNINALTVCHKTIEAINEFERKIIYIEKRHKAHKEQVLKDKFIKQKKQEMWKEEITKKRKEKKEKQRDSNCIYQDLIIK